MKVMQTKCGNHAQGMDYERCSVKTMPSSVISTFTYYPESLVLRVQFVSGRVYDYKNIPESVYKKMLAARSKGIFLNRFIKGFYDFEKIA